MSALQRCMTLSASLINFGNIALMQVELRCSMPSSPLMPNSFGPATWNRWFANSAVGKIKVNTALVMKTSQGRQDLHQHHEPCDFFLKQAQSLPYCSW